GSVLEDNPRAIAETLAERLRDEVDPARIQNVAVAGPGFINFRFAQDYLFEGLSDLLAEGDTFGQTDAGEGQRALVEYVSANPTGPLNVGHGRNAVLGDTIANLLDWTGYEVTREYYYNDAGRQMRVLAQSVRARYEERAAEAVPTRTLTLDDETTVEVPESFPEDGYLGQYIVDIAEDLYAKHGDALLDTEDTTPFREAAEDAIFADIGATLRALNVDIDAFANEQDLYDEGGVQDVLDGLEEANYTYEDEGALWLKTTEFGKEDDTVLIKQTGEPTYRTPDIAYHAHKFERGYDLMVDVFGADHHAAYPDVLSALDVLGYDVDRVDIVLYQFVTLVRDGEPVKMSTRRANYVTLDDLIDQVLAEEESEKNPVFYLQYAHARICSVLDTAEEVGFSHDEEADLSRLTHEAEIALIKELLRFPQALQNAADARAPHFVPNYLRDVATAFSQFYDNCRIIGEEDELASARMRLALAAKTVLNNGLTVLGISAPRRM
ncbi:MAG: arginine--tRNA ligase, partial [Bacteroidetes bacterium QS_1_63_11]